MTADRGWVSEAIGRDRELRWDLAVHPWPGDHEEGLKVRLLADPPSPLDEYPFLRTDEGFVVPGKAHLGQGDLVFTDGHFAVVELKWFDPEDSGKTRRARRCAQALRRQEPAAVDVRAFTVGNLYQGPPVLMEINL